MTAPEINWIAVLAAGAGAWITGAVWYGVLGKAWLAALGTTREEHKVKPLVPMLLSAASALILAGVLATFIAIATRPERAHIADGLLIAFACWLGFALTTMVVNHAFEGRNAMLTLIDGGHWLAAFLVSGGIIAAFG
jgi:hypothetical protein